VHTYLNSSIREITTYFNAEHHIPEHTLVYLVKRNIAASLKLENPVEYIYGSNKKHRMSLAATPYLGLKLHHQ
jgi:hypothetical protein